MPRAATPDKRVMEEFWLFVRERWLIRERRMRGMPKNVGVPMPPQPSQVFAELTTTYGRIDAPAQPIVVRAAVIHDVSWTTAARFHAQIMDRSGTRNSGGLKVPASPRRVFGEPK